MTDLIERARAWIEADPDPSTRAELQAVIEAGDIRDLGSRMDSALEFGTAGIRGRVGAGPGRMNRAVVLRTTFGLARYLLDEAPEGPVGAVVIGFDARPDSRQFAEDAAGVLAAAGIPVMYFPEVTPTPLVAYAAKLLRAVAAVVVTASHNPRADNGYKVYGSQSSQIVSPTDIQIQAAIERAPPADRIERIEDAFTTESALIASVPGDIFESYWKEVSASRSRREGSALTIVYTPMHGVGGDTVFAMMRRAGHHGIVAVAEQAEPDGTFPTVDYPNPEEPGTLDLAIDLALDKNADLIVANDPDADRLAVVVPAGEEWRRLSGNEVGVMMGAYLLAHDSDPATAILVSSIVSSPMLGYLARSYGASHTQTLTGFKWIVKAGLALEEETGGRFIFGYEEALGYTIGSAVRDKDGMSAALIFTDLVADLDDEDRSPLDYLFDLWRTHGLWVSAQTSIRSEGPGGLEKMRAAVDRLGDSPPSRIDGVEVTHTTDFRRGGENRPVWLGEQALIEFSLGDRGRILVRPSGTEPKLKIYVDLRSDTGGSPRDEHGALTLEAAAMGEAMGALIEL